MAPIINLNSSDENCTYTTLLFIQTQATSMNVMKGHVVVEHEGDADRTIVMKGIEVAQKSKSGAVVADDTDILVMLVHMWNQAMCDLFLHHEATESIKKDVEIISIKKNVASSLLSHVKENLRFIHAWGGSDTTSTLFGQGKTALKLVESNGDFDRYLYSVFQDPFAT